MSKGRNEPVNDYQNMQTNPMSSNDNLFQKSMEAPHDLSTIAAQYSFHKDLKNQSPSATKFRRNRHGNYHTLALRQKSNQDWIQPKISMQTLESEKPVLVNDRSISSEV